MEEREEIANILASFCQSLKDQILDYYNRYNSYLKDLFADKKIDLTFKLAYENEKVIKQTVGQMVKTTKIGLSTIGVSKNRLSQDEKRFNEIANKKGDDYPDYGSYFLIDLKIIIDKILFEILVEYLIDKDSSKIENLDLFDLLPRNFINQLDKFKDDFISSTHIKRVINSQLLQLDSIVDPSELSLKVGITKAEEPKVKLPKVKELKVEIKEVDILVQLEEAKQLNIEALKLSIKESAKIAKPIEKEIPKITPAPPTIPEEPTKATPPPPVVPPTATPEAVFKPAEIVELKPEDLIPHKIKPPIQEPPVAVVEPPLVEPPIKEIIPAVIEEPVLEIPKTYLDYFGNFPSISIDVINKFNINTTNLINSKTNNSEYFDLENLFYYIAVLKMLNFSVPFTNNEIIEIVGNFINGKIFSTAKDIEPDPISIFYGLAILSEFNLINNTDVVDLLNIEIFLESELNRFMPEKLHLNFYTFLSFNLLQKSGAIITNKGPLLNSILSFDIKNLEDYNAVLDIYEHLGIIKAIDSNANLSHFKGLYSQDLKKLQAPDGSIKETITDSARTLLILNLLELQKQEFKFCQDLLQYLGTTSFFDMSNQNLEFNWQFDKLGYTIELRMLFWALLAHSQHVPLF